MFTGLVTRIRPGSNGSQGEMGWPIYLGVKWFSGGIFNATDSDKVIMSSGKLGYGVWRTLVTFGQPQLSILGV